MGLDTVELVMQVEKTFAITIPDHEAEKMVTVGALHDFVMQASEAGSHTLDSDQVWDQITEILTEDYEAFHERRSLVMPGSFEIWDWINIFPSSGWHFSVRLHSCRWAEDVNTDTFPCLRGTENG